MSVTPSFSNFNVDDYSGLFRKYPTYNRLLTNLKMFEEVPIDVPKFAFDYLIELNQDAINPVERYGSEFMTTVKNKASLHQIELPYYGLMDSVNVGDWQGKRMPGENREMRAEDVQFGYLLSHKETFEDTIEKAFADALFRNVQNTQYTQEPLLDFSAEFGLTQQTQNINFSSASTDVDSALDDVFIKVKTALGSKTRYMSKMICVCGPQYFKAVKSNQKVRDAFTYVQPFNPENIIHNYHEVMPGVQYFDYNNIMFILTVDPLHNVGTNDAYYFPLMREGAGVYKHIAGPASRHAGMAMAGGARYHQYVLTDPKFLNTEVVGEMSLLAANYLPNIVVKSTNA